MTRRPFSKREKQELALVQVVTIPEIVELWGKARKTVEMAILKDKIATRQTLGGKIILVSTDSVVALWGKPKHEPGLKALLASEVK